MTSLKALKRIKEDSSKRLCPKCGTEMRQKYDDFDELIPGVLHCYEWSGGCGHEENAGGEHQ